ELKIPSSRRHVMDSRGALALAWSPGDYLTFAGPNRTVHFWRPGDGLLKRLFPLAERVQALAWSPGGKRLAVGVENACLVFARAEAHPHAPVLGPALAQLPVNRLGSVAWSADGAVLALGGADGSVRLWNPEGRTVATLPERHQGEVVCLAFSPDSRVLAARSP